MVNKNKIFEGENAINYFLRPDSVGFTPVVELPASVNPFLKDKVHIFVKMVQFVPLFNIKSLPAYNMLCNIPEKELKDIKNLVEYSSGNTVLSLTVLAQYFGISKMHAIITPDVPLHKKRLLQLLGTNLLISSGPASPGVFDQEGGIYDAQKLGTKRGWYNLNQYVNEANKNASEKYIGKELWSQFGRRLNVFVSSIGTGGTIFGAGSFLKKQNKNIFVLGTAIKKGEAIPGPRGEVAIHKLGIPWEKVTDDVLSIGSKEAYQYSLNLIRLGLFVGPSTGMQLSALLKKLKELKNKKQLKNFKNKKGEIICCLIACDTMFPYIDDYFSTLPAELFSKVKEL